MKRGRKKTTNVTLFSRFSNKDVGRLDEAISVLNSAPENYAEIGRGSFIRKAVSDAVSKILTTKEGI